MRQVGRVERPQRTPYDRLLGIARVWYRGPDDSTSSLTAVRGQAQEPSGRPWRRGVAALRDWSGLKDRPVVEKGLERIVSGPQVNQRAAWAIPINGGPVNFTTPGYLKALDDLRVAQRVIAQMTRIQQVELPTLAAADGIVRVWQQQGPRRSEVQVTRIERSPVARHKPIEHHLQP